MNAGKHIILDTYEVSDETFLRLHNDNYTDFHNHILASLKKNNMTIVNHQVLSLHCIY
jgi:hypothetical protein